MCDWNQIIAIISVNIAVMAIFGTFVLWAFNKLDGDIKSLSNKLDADMKIQTSRTDQLYQMFIDLLKERRERTDP